MIKGKGGKVRSVPLTEEAKALVREIVAHSERGRKVFVDPSEKTHQVIKHIQGWIGENREKFSHRRLTIHGLCNPPVAAQRRFMSGGNRGVVTILGPTVVPFYVTVENVQAR